MAQQGQVFPLAGRQGDATRWAYRYRRTESHRPQPAPLDGGDEVVAGRVRPEREQAGDGYGIQAVEEITVDLQEIREQERARRTRRRSRERAMPSEPRRQAAQRREAATRRPSACALMTAPFCTSIARRPRSAIGGGTHADAGFRRPVATRWTWGFSPCSVGRSVPKASSRRCRCAMAIPPPSPELVRRGEARSTRRRARCARSHEIIEFEFHISPAPSSSRPQTGVGTCGASSSSRWRCSGCRSVGVGSRRPRQCRE